MAVAKLDSVNGSSNNEEAKEKAQIESRVAEDGVYCLNGVNYRWEIRPLNSGPTGSGLMKECLKKQEMSSEECFVSC